MRICKRIGILLTIAAVAAVCVLFYPREEKAPVYGKLSYRIRGGEAVIIGCDPSASGELEIPAAIENCPVTEIAGSAFRDCADLTRIMIPDSVTGIGDLAFPQGTGLEYNLYDNARYLGNEENPYLILVESVSDDISKCKIHPGTKIIYEYAFQDCDWLRSLTIPDGVTTVDDMAFASCTRLESVTIPDTVTLIGDSAFRNCSALSAIDLPQSISLIGYAAFYYCTGLTSVTIPAGVSFIGGEAFYGCNALTSVDLPVGVTYIGADAFLNCAALTSVTYDGDQAQWDTISILPGNEYLLSAQRISAD